MNSLFYFVIFNTVGNNTDFTVLKYTGNTVVRQVEIMQRLQVISKDFQSSNSREYERKIDKFLNDYMGKEYMEIKKTNSPLFEESKVCFMLPEEDKYMFVDLKQQLEYFGYNDGIKGYGIKKWFDYHFMPYQLNDEDFNAVSSKLKTLEQYRDYLCETGKDLALLNSTELVSCLEMVGLY